MSSNETSKCFISKSQASGLRIIEREHAIDQETSRRKTYSGFAPPGRPKEWRESVLESLKNTTEAKFRIEKKAGDGWLGGQLRKG